MKTRLFKAALFGMVALFVGCNKDDNPGTTPAETTLPRNPIEQLKGFRNQVERAKLHPEMRSTELMPLSDALWDVENLFNLTFTDAEQYYAQTNDHTFSLYLPVGENDQVSVSDAVALYTQTVDQARQAMASDAFDDKAFVTLNILQTAKENNTLRVDFSGKTGKRSDYNPPVAHVDGPFGEDDNWMFACDLGKCDDPDIPSGADKQLQEKLYIELIEPYIETSPGYRNIYLNRKRVIFDGSNYSLIFYRPTPDDLCIDHWDMNAYYSGEKRTILYVIPEQLHLSGYQPISIMIDGYSPENSPAITHRNDVEYGIQMKVRTDEFGEVEDLL